MSVTLIPSVTIKNRKEKSCNLEYKNIYSNQVQSNIKKTVFNDLKKTYQKAIAKDVKIKNAHVRFSVSITKYESVRQKENFFR